MLLLDEDWLRGGMIIVILMMFATKLLNWVELKWCIVSIPAEWSVFMWLENVLWWMMLWLKLGRIDNF